MIRRHLAIAVLTAGLIAASQPAPAAPITTPDINYIYAQPSFGDDPIIIHYLAPIYLNRPDLNVLGSAADWANLAAAAPATSPIVNAFFIDAITWCGVAAPNIVGCAATPGNVLVLDAYFMQRGGVSADQDIAHELGHNLGLPHQNEATPGVGDNLMNPILWGDLTLTAAQVAALRLSDLIQGDHDEGWFIQIQPISVPEPMTLGILGLGLAALVGTRRRGR